MGRLQALVAIVLSVVLAGGVGAFAYWHYVQEEAAREQQELAKAQKRAKKMEISPKARRLLNDLTLEQKVAQLFIVRPEALTNVQTAIAAGESTRKALTECPVGGLYYTSQNLQSPEQITEMLRNSQNYTKDACGLPLFTCVTEEGGSAVTVASNRSFGVPKVESMAYIGATNDPEKARDAAHAMGTYLAALGFNVNLAPVAEVASSYGTGMAQRSFGDSAEEIAPMVAAQVEGFSRAGVFCAPKCFPGAEDASGGSADGRVYSNATRQQMLEGTVRPFAAAIEEGAPMIMVGHLCCLGVEEGGGLPASLNSGVIQGLLRDELGFEGLVITDSFEDEAITPRTCDEKDQAVQAIEAGADLVFLPKDFKRAYDGVLDAVDRGEITEERIDESVGRIVEAKLKLM